MREGGREGGREREGEGGRLHAHLLMCNSARRQDRKFYEDDSLVISRGAP